MARRFYLTTPIYYINAAPHVGNAYSTLVADTLARYHRLRGDDTHLLTGTDEHGQKIERAAQERGLAPQPYVDGFAAQFQQTWPQLHIATNDFIRTTDPGHQARAQKLWQRIQGRGDIYLGHYEGWYCVADEAFYTEKDLVNGLSPTGRPVERVREASYFFRLKKYTDVLLDFYERHPTFVEPDTRFNEVKSFVRGGLEDLSISRTSFRWGVPVPDDPAHVMYVWFDALTNYWTALGDDNDDRRRFWPPDVHLVGKEILRFHAVYWPAFLLAAGFSEDDLPKKIFAHGWLTVNGEKMSKSSGNFLDPIKIADAIGADALRYYLLRAVAFGQDGDFNHQDLLTRLNSELANDLGNLLNRTLALCAKFTVSQTPAAGDVTELEQALAAGATDAAVQAAECFEHLAPHRGLDAIWKFCRQANQYVDQAAPWAAAKRGDLPRVGTILANLLEALRWLSVLTAPVLPERATEMRRQLGLAPLAPAVDMNQWPASWQPRPAGETLLAGEPLFPRLDEAARTAILSQLVPVAAVDAASPDKPQHAPAAHATTAPAKAPSPSEGTLAPIEYAQFAQIDLRVGLIVAAEKVPKKDKLLDLRVDVGEAEPRRIVAGLALSFAAADLVGKRVVVVANLAPRDFGKGLVSHGMILAAGPSEALHLPHVPASIPPGTPVKLSERR